MKMILGKKLGMTRIFDKEGKAFAVTLIQAGPCVITQVKTQEKDGYNALQLGFGDAKEKNISKPMLGHLKKSSCKCNHISEIVVSENDEALKSKLGDKISVEIFDNDEIVEITGVGKGKGFSGVIKRHHFSRGPETHGSDHHRAPGSIGCMFPQHVLKGKKLPGRLGGERTTVKGLKIVDIDKKNNLIAVSGAIPGAVKSIVAIKA